MPRRLATSRRLRLLGRALLQFVVLLQLLRGGHHNSTIMPLAYTHPRFALQPSVNWIASGFAVFVLSALRSGGRLPLTLGQWISKIAASPLKYC